ncbi:MAG: hypothetical protein LBM93_07820 [Oscillospiraceae bacterium]|jgi:uncharacterized membrane protein YkoI|nr:hypothetical protein [Oscillospiraceae bacterium]
MKIKKTLTLLTAICLLFSLTACDNSNDKSADKSGNSDVGSDGDNANNTGNSLSSDALESLEPTTVFTESEDEIKDIINKNINLKAADNLKINVPEKAVVLKYHSQLFSTGNADFKENYKYMQDMFAYYYPDKTFNEDYLFYTGGSSDVNYDEEGNQIQYYNAVKDHYDDLVSGAEEFAYIFYDETYHQDITEWNSQVFIQGDKSYVTLNKGKTLSLGDKVRSEDGMTMESNTYPKFNNYDPNMYCEFVGTYPPDSEEVFKLLDKEISIKDAAEFYKKYITDLKYPVKDNFDFTIMNVEVYKVNEDVHCYKFNMTNSYKEIDFYYAPTDVYRSSDADAGTNEHYQGSQESAVMVESNDVDILSAHQSSQMVENARQISKMQSIEDVFKEVSGNLSNQVEFEVREVNFVYIRKMDKDENGYINIETYGCDVYPVWNFILNNPNDGLYYEVQINAEDGKEFSYRTFSLEDSLND